MEITGVPTFALIVDTTGTIYRSSSHAVGLLCGRGLADVLDETSFRKLTHGMARAAAGETLHGWEINIPTASGVRVLTLDIAPLADLIIIVGVDVTRYMEAASESGRGQIESQDALERATGLLVSRASHELRTPLNQIMGFATLLEMDAASLSADQNESVAHILEGSRHLLALVDDVIGIADARSGELRISIVDGIDPREVAGDVVASLHELATTRGIVLSVRMGDDLRITADRDLLHAALHELVTNAIHYGPPGDVVDVSAYAVDAGVQVDVHDAGISLTPREVALMTAPFERLARTRDGVPGAGLGLAQAHASIGAIGGALEVTSGPGEGTTFSMVLPTSGVAPERARPQRAVGPRGS